MRNMCKCVTFGCLTLMCIWMLACGKLVRREVDRSWADEEESIEERFNGVDLPADGFRVPERISESAGARVAAEQIDWQLVDSLRRLGPEVDSVTTIYRVQLFASQYYSEAVEEKGYAEYSFDEPVYIVYDVPYYKILMGNCSTGECGRRLLENARSFGYSDGWLVESPPDSLYYKFILPSDSLGSPDSTVVDSTYDLEKQ